MVTLEYFRTGEKLYRSAMAGEFDEFLIYHGVKELQPFLSDKSWQVPPIDFRNDPNKEDVYIQPISKTIIGRSAIPGFDSVIEEFFSHTSIHSSDNTAADFIQIPLWHFPITEKLNYAQIKHTRDHLQPTLLQFKNDLKELSQAIFPLPFSIENFALIKQLTNDKLLIYKEAIQQSIDESLYINKAKNQFSKDSGTTFCLGIASAETLLDYFEKTKTILPYVAAEIKQQVSRHFNLSSSFLFSYFIINTTNYPLGKR